MCSSWCARTIPFEQEGNGEMQDQAAQIESHKAFMPEADESDSFWSANENPVTEPEQSPTPVYRVESNCSANEDSEAEPIGNCT